MRFSLKQSNCVCVVITLTSSIVTCNCTNKSNDQIDISCDNKELTKVPEPISSQYTSLSLENNQFKNLSSDSLKNSNKLDLSSKPNGVTQLKRIYVSHNQIDSLANTLTGWYPKLQ